MLRERFAVSVIGIALCLSGLASGRCAAQSFNFVAVDVPCSACPGGIARRTALSGINPAGDIVGVYTDAVGAQHGFLLRGGQFTRLDFPGAISTAARGINAKGDIVGSYIVPVSSAPLGSPAYCPAAGSPPCIKGFLYSHGRFSTVLFPGHPGAIPQHITPDGSIYGCLHDFDLMGSMFGAAWTRFGDTSLAANGGELSGMSVPDSMHTSATPGSNLIVGLYGDMSTGHQHGYLLRNGMFQTYDVPNSTFTWIWDINPREEFVGTYKDAVGKQHGFLQFSDGTTPITIDYQNAVTSIAMGINPEGAIVGQYTDTGGHTHGFLAVPAH